MNQGEFMQAFSTELVRHLYKVQTDNTDFIRFAALYSGPWKKIKHKFREKVVRVAEDRSYINMNRPFLDFVFSQNEGLEETYKMLQDEQSRRLMVMLLAFRVLGNRRVKLPTNDAYYWESMGKIKQALKKSHSISIPTLDGCLDYYELEDIEFPICLNAHALNIICTFMLQQYRYEQGRRVVQVELGDVVIDGGGCWGDTSLYFAHMAGKDGKVYCFEFLPENLDIIRENLKLNDSIKDRIQIIPEALWDKSGENVSYHEKMQSSRLTPDQHQKSQALTRSIDDFVEEKGLERVDFIKMDIEGSELRALKGAEHTIKTFRPKLAISLYHKDEDFITIPQYLVGLGLGYEFFLGHATIHSEETVLFASPEGR
jgi:FkbM family methyltransferase